MKTKKTAILIIAIAAVLAVCLLAFFLSRQASRSIPSLGALASQYAEQEEADITDELKGISYEDLTESWGSEDKTVSSEVDDWKLPQTADDSSLKYVEIIFSPAGKVVQANIFTDGIDSHSLE